MAATSSRASPTLPRVAVCEERGNTMRSSPGAHAAMPLGRRAIAVLAVLALILVGLSVSIGTAQAADYRVNLRVLVVTNGNPSEQAIATQLQREGIPYK